MQVFRSSFSFVSLFLSLSKETISFKNRFWVTDFWSSVGFWLLFLSVCSLSRRALFREFSELFGLPFLFLFFFWAAIFFISSSLTSKLGLNRRSFISFLTMHKICLSPSAIRCICVGIESLGLYLSSSIMSSQSSSSLKNLCTTL